MLKIYFLLFILLLTGCATTQKSPQIFYDKTKDTNKRVINIPDLNTINTVEVGDNMYEKLYFLPKNTYSVEVLGSLDLKGGKDRSYWWLLLGVPGAVIMEATADKNMKTIEKHSAKPLLLWHDSDYKTICYKGFKCLIDVKNTGEFTHLAKYPDGELIKLEERLKYKLIPTPPEFKKDSFKYTVLYQGRLDNKIKLSFREFYGNMARPSFTQDIYYELDEEGMALIGFKGLRIKIKNATNFNVTYKVIQDYN